MQHPSGSEQSRLDALQAPHYQVMDKLIKEMWPIPATTINGRRAKVEVLLVCILGDKWRVNDDEADYDIHMARRLLIECGGGQPADILADQFA
jgi:hypothetical protein